MRRWQDKNNCVYRTLIILTVAILNTACMLLTFDTSHSEMSSLNKVLKKRPVMSVILLTHHVPMGHPYVVTSVEHSLPSAIYPLIASLSS